jgi:N-acetylglucosaminyldiphosphoundecaprenol N-acetyl-beta-D-mannosaminyltransferase
MPEQLQTSPGFPERDVLGTRLQCTTYDQFIRFCQWRCRQEGVIAVDFTNTHIVTLRRDDVRFRDLTSRFDYFIPDGMPLIWALNAGGAKLRDRVYGPTFMRECVLRSPAPFTHYFLGGSQECLEALTKVFSNQNTSVQIVGARNGYFNSAAEPEIVNEINALSPDFIWIGLGTPKQQEWIHRHKSAIRRGILFAVGFAFDVNAGTKKDAPGTMQRAGLTWLYRLLTEPRRLAPRYLKYNSLFVWYLIRDAMRKAK